jgi:hypothetical protein
MKTLVLSIIACLLVYNGRCQYTKKYFYKTLLELTSSNNDSISYYILKLKVGQKGEIKKVDILFFKNDSVQSKELKNSHLNYVLKDIISDTTFEYNSKHENNLIICPYMIKKVKFIKNPNKELVFSVSDINKLFTLLKEFYGSNHLKYRLVTPSILFNEESYN